MSAVETFSRTRRHDAPGLQIHLPPEILRAAEMAAASAGMTAEALIVDILRDAFEPVFAGRGALALETGKVGA